MTRLEQFTTYKFITPTGNKSIHVRVLFRVKLEGKENAEVQYNHRHLEQRPGNANCIAEAAEGVTECFSKDISKNSIFQLSPGTWDLRLWLTLATCSPLVPKTSGNHVIAPVLGRKTER